MHRPGAVPRPASPRDEGVRTRNASRLEENALKRPRAAREQSPPRYRPADPGKLSSPRRGRPLRRSA